ncbi:MAG: 3'-5' exonuclease [Chlorobi bacterium]|nr:MAG: 3'-5' exonuclease [Bacteroidota bacterium]KXK34669.1 MAG: 3'-5' exonuclease, PolB [Chlorobi bacterium OLB6]MBE2265223.1 ribonuclease H-like domain-containing protein [Flavobacteriales bacterium]MBL1160972.1 3'-5' exonuclease [Chlorobiota bacterium]MBW7852930.1 ribonuclease H-like domain-containing protein [Candidatus Kapabacteria bacterium]MCC6330818.1 ribonuclease H-like domain-containing protein [Ignavibacteria bacterium]
MLAFDIETIGHPLEYFDPVQQEYLLRSAKTDEEKAQKINEFALSPFTGRIVTIGMSMVKETPDGTMTTQDVAYMVDPSMGRDEQRREHRLESGATAYVSSEEMMLQSWWRLLAKQPDLHLISFNGRGFDAPWLMLRSAVLGIRPSRNLMDGTRFSYSHHTDLLDKLTFYNRTSVGATRMFNFDFFAKSFGIESPKAAGVDGSKVADLFANGQYDDIAEYCLRDVRATLQLYQKWEQLLKY